MIVWVLIVTAWGGGAAPGGLAAFSVDNIATAESCEQLAKVVRQNPRMSAVCAPVRKIKP
jgi:hypothetical protein